MLLIKDGGENNLAPKVVVLAIYYRHFLQFILVISFTHYAW